MNRAVAESGTRRVSLWVAVVIGVVAFVSGALAGNSTSFGAKNLTIVSGEATLLNTDNGLTSFDTDDPEEQLAFYANAVWWSDKNTIGEGDPPCLQERRAVPVRVGYTWVDFPKISAPVVAWVECR